MESVAAPVLSATAQRALAAYGGADRWARATAVEATLSADGLAFRIKWRRPLDHVHVRAELAEPRLNFEPFGSDGELGILFGLGVRVVDSGGRIFNSRSNPRKYFPYGRRALWWDDLDFLYFAGYATWNYLSLPRLLLRDDIIWTPAGEHALDAYFPPNIPTHSKDQRFHFDPVTGLLAQHDYTAEVFGPWAKAAHVVLEHREWDGIPYAAQRRVTPRGPDGHPLTGPVLVEIEIHDWRLVE